MRGIRRRAGTLIRSRKGILSMPVKLTISFLIIALMVPPVMTLAEDIQDDIENHELMYVAETLADEISKVYSKSPNYRSHIELDIPPHCRIDVGGDESRVIRMYSDDTQIGTAISRAPVVSENSLYGYVILEIANSDGGVEVTEL